MFRLRDRSYFKLIPGNELKSYGNKIVQIQYPQVYQNSQGYPVFLREVEDEDGDMLNNS